MRFCAPGYSYANGNNTYVNDLASQKDGLWVTNTEAGDPKLVVTLSQLATFLPEASMNGAYHYINHAAFSPGGKKIVFFHRWRFPNREWTRMFTYNIETHKLHLFDTAGMVSHFTWKDEEHVLAWARLSVELNDHYVVFKDGTQEQEIIGKNIFISDGHPSFSPDRRFIYRMVGPTAMSNLPSSVSRRERTIAEFTLSLERVLPQDLRTPVAFCGPTSFREPEIDNCWHPYMINRGFLFFLVDQIPKLIRAWGGGIRRYVRGNFGSYILKPLSGATVLGITPRSICTLTNMGIQTAYCHPDDALQMSWLILDEAVKEAKGYPVSRTKMLITVWRVLYAWLRAAFPFELRDQGWAIASVLSLRWILGLQWVTLWMLSHKLREVLTTLHPNQVHAVHEIWPWARVVWKEAARLNIMTSTIQHASIVRTKLWYFLTAEERAVGLAVPSQFAVFSQKEKDMLQPFFPETKFSIGCSPRYMHWKERQEQRNDQNNKIDSNAPILFATSVPWWDNETVLQGVRKLVKAGSRRPLRALVHPHASIPKRWKHWLDSATANGMIEIPKKPFQDEILNAAVVIGMNTTILGEAAAMGRPVIVLTTDDYLSFSMPVGIRVPLSELNAERIEQVIIDMHQARDDFMLQGVEALGLDKPVARICA